MLKYIKLFLLTALSVSALGQKFMIKNNDTLPYKNSMVIVTDTEHYSTKTMYPGDTTYIGECRTFEKINGQIVNVSDDECLRQGFWIEKDSLGNYWKGNYENNHEKGIWKEFDKNGRLLKEVEFIYFSGDEELVKEVDYTTGKPVEKINRVFYSFYAKWGYWLYALMCLSFFGRYFLNSRIYNLENGIIFSSFPMRPKWIFYGTDGQYMHGVNSFFTFWFFNYKPENRKFVIISNILSATAVVIFWGILIGLAVSGELNHNN